MNSFAACFLLFVAAGGAMAGMASHAEEHKGPMLASSYGGSAPAPAPSYGGPAPAAAPSYGGPAPAPAPAYGGGAASIPAPPCPRNYLFSCQPNLTPAPCAQPAPAYGSSGAYSQNYPVYAVPVPQYVNAANVNGLVY